MAKVRARIPRKYYLIPLVAAVALTVSIRTYLWWSPQAEFGNDLNLLIVAVVCGIFYVCGLAVSGVVYLVKHRRR